MIIPLIPSSSRPWISVFQLKDVSGSFVILCGSSCVDSSGSKSKNPDEKKALTLFHQVS